MELALLARRRRPDLRVGGFVGLALLATFSLCAVPLLPPSAWAYTHLRADDLPTTITGSRTVNIVFIGLEPSTGPQQIHPDFLSRLQSSFIVPSGTNFGAFSPRVYNGQMLHRTVDYNIVFAPSAYQDYFFSRLLDMALGLEGSVRGHPQANVATVRVIRVPNFEQSPGSFRDACDFDNNPFFTFYPTRRETACLLSTQFKVPSPPGLPQIFDIPVTPFQWIYNFENPGSPRTIFFDPHFDIPTPVPSTRSPRISSSMPRRSPRS